MIQYLNNQNLKLYYGFIRKINQINRQISNSRIKDKMIREKIKLDGFQEIYFLIRRKLKFYVLMNDIQI